MLIIRKLATLVEGNLKAPFSIATTLRFKEGRYFPWIAPLILDLYHLMPSVKATSSTFFFFWVFSMTQPQIEPWSPGPLVNTLLISPMARSDFYMHIITENIAHCKEIFLSIKMFSE